MPIIIHNVTCCDRKYLKKLRTCSWILNSMKTDFKVLKSNEANSLIEIFFCFTQPKILFVFFFKTGFYSHTRIPRIKSLAFSLEARDWLIVCEKDRKLLRFPVSLLRATGQINKAYLFPLQSLCTDLYPPPRICPVALKRNSYKKTYLLRHFFYTA